MTATPAVQGRCPACARTTLILGVGGYVTCSHLQCRNPFAASNLLERQPARRVSQPAAPANVSSFELLADLADLTDLAEAARAEHRRQMAAIEAAIMADLTAAGITTVVREDPVEQVAAEPTTLAMFVERFTDRTAPGTPASAYGMDALLGLPLVPDPELPPGQIHLRPHIRLAMGDQHD